MGSFPFEAPYGSFQVMELATLPGYLTMDKPVAVEVNAAEVQLDPIANNQMVVHISKVDAETGEELPGATLELYGPDGTLIETWGNLRHPPRRHGAACGRGLCAEGNHRSGGLPAGGGHHLCRGGNFGNPVRGHGG